LLGHDDFIMSERYNFSLTTFSPSGKLVQIEYALNAVSQGALTVGIKVKRGVVLVSEKKASSPLIEDSHIEKVAKIAETLGLVYSGIGPDARLLILQARKLAQAHIRTFGKEPSAHSLTRDLASVMQEYTQSGGVRPFGTSLLIAGFDYNKESDSHEPVLYQLDPSGTFWTWKATAIGKNYQSAKTFLEKRYSQNIFRFTEDLEFEDAIHTALQTMRQGYDGQMTSENIQIGLLDTEKKKFNILNSDEIQDYIQYSLH
jgi:20S proteasome subunit alpha 2